MKKMFLMIVLAGLLFGLNPPRNLVAVSNLENRVDLKWSPPQRVVETYEIAYDSGAGGCDEGEKWDILSVRFTPEENCSLMGINFFPFTMYPGIVVYIWVYPDNGHGRPDMSFPLSAPVPVTLEGSFVWQTVDLSELGLVFSAGEDFHIGIQKTMSTDTFPHCIVSDTDPVGRSWMYDASGFVFVPVAGDLKLRALVTSTSGLLRVMSSSEHKQIFELHDRPHIVSMFLPTDSVQFYILYRDTLPDTLSMTPLSTVSDTLYTDHTAVNNKTYYYSVKAMYSGGSSGFSNIASATPRSSSVTVIYDTLKYDDGVPEATVAWTYPNALGTLFVPHTPARIFGLAYFFLSHGEFTPGVWWAPDSIPTSPAMTTTALINAPDIGWHYVPSWNTVVVDMPFVATCAPTSSISLGIDVPGATISYDYSHSLGEWVAVRDTTYMIRTVLEHANNTMYIHIHRGWNLVGVPIILIDSLASAVFPNSITMAFEDGVFLPVDYVAPGKAYFVFSMVDTSYTIVGNIPIMSMDVPVRRGWNFITVPNKYRGYFLPAVATFPAGLLGPYPQAYRVSYNPDGGAEFVTTQTLVPGIGYWIQATANGIIRFGP